MGKHAIIIIKNNKDEYLQYYDNRWDSYLFLNCKINDHFDIEKIKQEIQNKLQTNIEDISYAMNKIHTKFSQSDKIYKEYQHYFFIVNISLHNDMLNKSFSINDTNFKWYSYEELLKDKRIMNVNSDIVNFVGEINKKGLREKYKNIRKNITNKEFKDNLIFEKIIKLPEFINSKVIAIYYSFDNEVDTTKLIEYSLKNKQVYLPRVINDHEMEFYKINSINEACYKSKYGILEPNINDDILKKEEIDLIIVPGICFDLKKNRIGYGKGYYDNYLKDTNVFKIGICYDEQLTDFSIQNSNIDIKMNLLITDKREIK